MHDMREAMEVERFLLPLERWTEAPREAQEVVFDSMGGGPVGIAKHPDKGWFVVMSGQGPFIAWREGEPYKRYRTGFQKDCETGGEDGMALEPAGLGVWPIVGYPFTVEAFQQKSRASMWQPDYD